MKHKIELSTVEIMLIDKALRLDMQNDVDNDMASLLVDRLNEIVKRDLEIQSPSKNLMC